MVKYNPAMMTSSNGSIFRVTGHLCGEFTGNSPVPGEFPVQRPVTRSFDVFFDLRLNKRLSEQSWGWWFETLPRPLWRHCNATQWRHLLMKCTHKKSHIVHFRTNYTKFWSSISKNGYGTVNHIFFYGTQTIGILCGYAIRSGRYPGGVSGPGRWLPDGCLPDRIA